MSGADGHSNPALDSDLPSTWQRMGMGIGIYVRMPKGAEPVFLAGPQRPVDFDDIESAIRFLKTIRDTLFAEEQAGA